MDSYDLSVYEKLTDDDLREICGGSWPTVIGLILGIGDFCIGFYNGWQNAKEDYQF